MIILAERVRDSVFTLYAVSLFPPPQIFTGGIITMFHAQLSIASKYDYIADKLKAGFKWLAETDIAAIADGK